MRIAGPYQPIPPEGTNEMIKFLGFGHINIVVDNIKIASDYYADLLGAIKTQAFPHFKNAGFAKSAGFLEYPEKLDVSIEFLEIPQANLFIELMEYHSPKGLQTIKKAKTNDLGGIRHICLRVEDIEQAFNHLKQSDVTLINSSTEYKSFYIDKIKPEAFYFYNQANESNAKLKQETCEMIGKIKFFYCIDRYGVQWEFEQGHNEI